MSDEIKKLGLPRIEAVPYSKGQEVYYCHSALDEPIRATFIKWVEGWINIEFSDGSRSIVRPSRVQKD